jgi:ArsR family transcriptional regulator, arsenate/arsenite/antimonite-responsive transcriptional repressor
VSPAARQWAIHGKSSLQEGFLDGGPTNLKSLLEEIFQDPSTHFSSYCKHGRTIHPLASLTFPESKSNFLAGFQSHGSGPGKLYGSSVSEARLQIMRLLLSAHPDGMVGGDISDELQRQDTSTLSHHLAKLKNEDLVRVQREGTYLRYGANTEELEELLRFLFAECCTRNKAIAPQKIVLCK